MTIQKCHFCGADERVIEGCGTDNYLCGSCGSEQSHFCTTRQRDQLQTRLREAEELLRDWVERCPTARQLTQIFLGLSNEK